MSEALSLAVIYGALLLLRIPLEKAGPFILLVAMLSRIEDWAKVVLLGMFLFVRYAHSREKSKSHIGRAGKKVTAMKKPKKESDSIIVTYTQPDGKVAKAAVDTDLRQPVAVSIGGEPTMGCHRIDGFGMIYAMPGGIMFAIETPILGFEQADRLIALTIEVAGICAGLNSEIEKLKQ